MQNKSNFELISAIRRYCNVNVSFGDWPKLLVEELNHPNHPDRAKQFQHQLADAILNNTISPAEYERLTEEDLETSEEVRERLHELWQDLYGNLDVSVS
jgi:hypothetical protein